MDNQEILTVEYKLCVTKDYLFALKKMENEDKTEVYPMSPLPYMGSSLNVAAHRPLDSAPYLEGIDVLPAINLEDRGCGKFKYAKKDIEFAYAQGWWRAANGISPTEVFEEKEFLDNLILPVAFQCETVPVFCTQNPHSKKPSPEDLEDINSSNPRAMSKVFNADGRTEWVGTYTFRSDL